MQHNATTTTAAKGHDWSGGGNQYCDGFIAAVQDVLDRNVPCALWLPTLSEVYTCIDHTELFEEFIGDRDPRRLLEDEDPAANRSLEECQCDDCSYEEPADDDDTDDTDEDDDDEQA